MISIIELGKLVWPDYQVPAHIVQFNNLSVDLLFSDKLSRLLINVSIRSGKSQWFSQLLPAWYLIYHPNKKVLLASSTAERVVEFSTKVRSIVAEFGPHLNNIKLDPASRARDNFKILGHGGGLYAVGAESSIAGVGAHLLIADDITRSQEAANSPSQRDKLFLWYNSEFVSRCEPGAKVIVVESRRGLDDISAKLLNLNKEKLNDDPNTNESLLYKQILFPALSNDNIPLWPERFPLNKLNEVRDELFEAGQESVWYSLWQQDPIAAAGAEFNQTLVGDFLLINEDKEDYDKVVISIDPALHKQDSGDNSVALVCGFNNSGNCNVFDGVFGRCDTTVLEDNVVKMIQIHNPNHIIIEVNGFQEMLADNILKKCNSVGVGCPMFKYTSTNKKVERIKMLITPLLHKNQLKIKKCAMGRSIVSELQQFPNGNKDDLIDALSLAIGMYNYSTGLSDEIVPKIRYI